MGKRIAKFEVYEERESFKSRLLGDITEGEWRWRLRAANGEIIASGEGYETRRGAQRGVAAVKRAVIAIVNAEDVEAIKRYAVLKTKWPKVKRVVKRKVMK